MAFVTLVSQPTRRGFILRHFEPETLTSLRILKERLIAKSLIDTGSVPQRVQRNTSRAMIVGAGWMTATARGDTGAR